MYLQMSEEHLQNITTHAALVTIALMRKRLELIHKHVMGTEKQEFSRKAMDFILSWCEEAMTEKEWEEPPKKKTQEVRPGDVDRIFEIRGHKLEVINARPKKPESGLSLKDFLKSLQGESGGDINGPSM